ncbi:MAG: hypothetical protein EOO65_01770 [Methanosarcinales archaeon]|nr:MAG: hypothetical protein EOO65_01770 [Methanosarcinales archaeon]
MRRAGAPPQEVVSVTVMYLSPSRRLNASATIAVNTDSDKLFKILADTRGAVWQEIKAKSDELSRFVFWKEGATALEIVTGERGEGQTSLSACRAHGGGPLLAATNVVNELGVVVSERCVNAARNLNAPAHAISRSLTADDGVFYIVLMDSIQQRAHAPLDVHGTCHR